MRTIIGIAPVLLAELLLCFGPGLCLLAACGVPLVVASVASPLIGITWIGFAGIAYGELGIPVTPLTITLPLLAMAVAAFVIRRLRANTPSQTDAPSWLPEWPLVALYACVGLVICWYVYVKRLSSADDFLWLWDNDTHLNIIRNFMRTHTASSLHISGYHEIPTTSAYVNTPAFYPAAWHALCALGAEFVGSGAAQALTAANCLFIGIFYPTSLCLLLAYIFPQRRTIQMVGALVAFCTTAFPWHPMLYGPLYPFVAGLCVAPLACVVLFLAVDAPPRSLRRMGWLAAGGASTLGIALLHTSVAFVLWVIVALYACWRIAWSDGPVLSLQVGPRWLAALVFLGLNALLWYLLATKVSLFSATVFSGQHRPLGQVRAALTAFNLAFGSSDHTGVFAQPVLFLLIVLGLARIMLRREGWGWLALPYLYFLVCYVLDVAFEWYITHILSGFWYTDSYRSSAMLCLCAVPLAALGLAWPIEALLGKLGDEGKPWVDRLPQPVRMGGALAVVGAAFVGLYASFLVGDPSPAFMETAHYVLVSYSWDGYPSMQGFVEQAREIVPTDSPVANNPYDGSVFAYGVSDLTTLFRSNDMAQPEMKPEAVIIQRRLCDIATDPEVRAAAEALNIHYVLQLEHDINGPVKASFGYSQDEWAGIDTIDETTPGFELILSEGDMRLYRITVLDE